MTKDLMNFAFGIEVKPRIYPRYYYLKTETVEERGVVQRRVSYSISDPDNDNKAYSIYDFSLDNIASLGNPAFLKPVIMSGNNSFAMPDSFQEASLSDFTLEGSKQSKS